MIIIKKLDDNDLDKARELYCEAFSKEMRVMSIPLVGVIIGVYLDDMLIGIAQIDYINHVFENERWGYINSFCIKEEYRHMGYGTRLLDYCTCYIKENGGNRILLTSNKNRVYAHMLYKKFGFMEVDTVLLNKYI